MNPRKFTILTVLFLAVFWLGWYTRGFVKSEGGAPAPAAASVILDATDAIDRFSQTGRTNELVEATRLFQLAKRDAPHDEKFPLLVIYYYTAQTDDPASPLRGKVCSAELHGERFEKYVPGDCNRLAQENHDKLLREVDKLLHEVK